MTSTLPSLAAAALLLITGSHLRAQTSPPPSFDQYSTPEVFKGKPAPAKPTSGEARHYRTVIKEGAKEGANFAGHYTITIWGCGTACVMFAIVDARTGKVFMAPFTVSWERTSDRSKT